MLHTLLDRIHTFASLRNLIVVSIPFLAMVGLLFVSPNSPEATISNLSGGQRLLDANFHYTAEQAYATIDAYGEQGRQYYLSVVAPTDIVIPIIYSLFLSVAITYIFRRAFAPARLLHMFSLAPFAIAIADYSENIAIVTLLLRYPARLEAVATLAGYFTSAKQLLFMGNTLLLTIGLLALAWAKVRPKNINWPMPLMPSGVGLFTWLQEAEFYQRLHQEAVALLPPGAGRQWLDVGCGPGLVARLAAARGYNTTGVDTDAHMIRAANRIAARKQSPATFSVGNVAELPAQSADVVSAASLLAVLDDKRQGLDMLWRCVRPGGALLIIEPTDQMTSANAGRLIANGLSGRHIHGLRLWAAARQGRTIDPELYNSLDAARLQTVPLLHGLVAAWVIQKKEE